jgi:hypothetical protein
MSTYTTIFEKNRYNLADAVGKSRTWFQQQAKLLSGQQIAPLRLINNDGDRNVSRVTPGELYLFAYDAKLQDKLDYWDMFPLVFPFRRLKDGFIGLNMHYLPYQYRIMLLDRLMDFKTNSKMNQHTRLKMSWDVINAASRYNWAQPCVHRYLINHIQTPMKKIESQDWATALMLPVERFVGASKQKVWTESMR